MPTYSYRCANCDFAFDQHQEFTDDSLTVCPNCGQPQLRKVFNAIGISFKGSGFYHNDSRAKPGAKPSKHGSSSSEKSTAPSTTSGTSDAPAKPKSDKTPAAKPATTSAAGSSGK